MSVARIEHPETYEDGKPKVGGLEDVRLGTVDRNIRCGTCGEDSFNCPGHFGHIELARPVFHVSLINRVKKILECVCFECGKLKIDASNPLFARARLIKDQKRRAKEVWNLAKNIMVCDGGDEEEDEFGQNDGKPKKAPHGGCGARQPKIRREGLKLLAVSQKNDEDAGARVEKKVITPAKVLEVFRVISDQDCMDMGCSPEFSRPEWMLITVLPVPPPQVRPSVSMDGAAGGMRSQDDLTFKLADILKTNIALKRHDAENAPAHITREFEDILQYHVATMVDNNIAGLPQAMQKSGRALKSIRQRLKGKEGRIRGNLMGKRVDFSSRTVITGDPNISIDEVGVPRSIARTLTFPERVTPLNIDRLQQLVRNGALEHPGANYITRQSGDRVSLRFVPQAGDQPLQIGDLVERHLQDGDYVIFNRQPSLHKMSMMGHRVRIMPFSTFRLNLSVTTPYNADFDGDEMNLHAPQSFETRAEIREIMAVPRQIISPQANKPVMGIVQDTLCGIRKFTLRDNFLTRDMVMNICMWIPDWDGQLPAPCILKPTPLWTGKQLMSMVIPDRINVSGKHSTHPDDEKDNISPGDTVVLIEDGVVLTGILSKRTVGNSAGGIIHVIMNEYGPEMAKKFFNGTQRVVNYWLLQNGFSIGIGDTVADKATMNQINSILKRAKEDVRDTILKAQRNQLEPQPGMTIRETFESTVNKLLNKAREDAGKAATKSLTPFNNAKQMVDAGSKGSEINISQMAACVGQQNVEGKRIPFGFRNRTLPHFLKDDQSPESRGFVENSYLRGLTPQEFFFHAMGGREGLIDTAVKTAETGYIQRRLVKALEDVMVKYDGTVRNALGHVVQFAYGEDGMDALGIERQDLEIMKMNDAQFQKRYRFDLSGSNKDDRTLLRRILRPDTLATMDLDETRAAVEAEFAQLSKDRHELRTFIFPSGESSWPLPANLRRIVQNAQVQYGCSDRSKVDLLPTTVIGEISRLLEECVVIPGQDQLSLDAQANATLLWQILVRSMLSSKRVLNEFRLSAEAFNYVIGEVKSRFMVTKVQAGEMVGTIAAQSIGEPATQMTLNTFHYAGVSSKNVTLGVPRLKEIINVARNIKTPSLTIYLSDEYRKTLDGAKSIQSKLEYTTLRKIAHSTEIYYDPNPRDTVVLADREFLESYWEMEEDESSTANLSPWLLRIILDRNRKLDKGISLNEIASAITQSFGPENIAVFHSDDNAALPVLHVRIKRDPKDMEEEDEKVDEEVFLRKIEANIMNQLPLGGVEGISRVYINDSKTSAIDPATGAFVAGKEYILETDGINLKHVMASDGVDYTRTYSNNPVEIGEVLGIEATRNALLRELRKVIEFDGSYVNYRHLALLCDVMTHKGTMMAISRHGINRSETGALARCSFEETVEILMEAAAIGENDPMKGVSEAIIMGQLAPLGTGEFDVLLDETKLARARALATQGQAFAADVDGLMGGRTPGGRTPGYAGAGSESPSQRHYGSQSPVYAGWQQNYEPGRDIVFSPMGPDSGRFTPGRGGWSPAGPLGTPRYSPTSYVFMRCTMFVVWLTDSVVFSPVLRILPREEAVIRRPGMAETLSGRNQVINKTIFSFDSLNFLQPQLFVSGLVGQVSSFG